MCTQAPAPGYTLCMQAPVANFKTPDWLRTGPNQSGTGAWVKWLLCTECSPSVPQAAILLGRHESSRDVRVLLETRECVQKLYFIIIVTIFRPNSVR